MIRKLIQKTFYNLGYEVRKLPLIPHSEGKKYQTAFTTKDALSRCYDRGIIINSVIDVGGSDGRWSIDCNAVYPKAKYLLVEALEEHKESLNAVTKQFSNFDYIIAAAGNKPGSIFFHKDDDLFGGSASNESFPGSVEVKMTTIDEEVKDRDLEGPFLIKLDTHGFEVPILEGARETIRQSSLIIIEAYNFKLTNDSLRYFELCAYMEKLGFSTIEVVDLMLRQHDAAFWQMDLFFIRSDSKEFSRNSYQ